MRRAGRKQTGKHEDPLAECKIRLPTFPETFLLDLSDNALHEVEEATFSSAAVLINVVDHRLLKVHCPVHRRELLLREASSFTEMIEEVHHYVINWSSCPGRRKRIREVKSV